MIAQLIQKAVTANKELVDALEKLSEVLGVTTNGAPVFEGEHIRITRELPAKVIPDPTGRKKSGQSQLKDRAKGASINVAKDPAKWPYETERTKIKREPSLTIQKELKLVIGMTRSTGITRAEIVKHIGKSLPAHMKRKANKSGFKAWKSSLGNLLRNYSAAGYLNCVQQDADRRNDLFTLGG